MCSGCAWDEGPWQLRGISLVWFLLQGLSGLAGGEGTALPLLHPITDGHLSLVTRARCGVCTAPSDSRGLSELLELLCQASTAHRSILSNDKTGFKHSVSLTLLPCLKSAPNSDFQSLPRCPEVPRGPALCSRVTLHTRTVPGVHPCAKSHLCAQALAESLL